jgi:hypothetical protein
MKISKKELQEIILEELKREMLEEGELEEGLGRKLRSLFGMQTQEDFDELVPEVTPGSQLEKAKKELERLATKGGGPNIAMADFIRDFGKSDPELEKLAASYDERSPNTKGPVTTAAQRLSARAAASRQVGPPTYRGAGPLGEGFINEAFEMNSLGKKDMIYLLKAFLENPPRAFTGFKPTEFHKKLQDEVITPKEGETRPDASPEPTADSRSEMRNKIRQAFKNLEKQDKTGFNTLFDKETEIRIGEFLKSASEKELSSLVDVVDNLLRYIDFNRLKEVILQVVGTGRPPRKKREVKMDERLIRENTSLTGWDMDVIILEEIIKDAFIRGTIRFF